MSDVENLQIGTIFIIMFFSVAGFLVPYYRGAPKTHEAAGDPWWLALQLFSAGTVFSVAVIHLLGENLEAFEGWEALEEEEEEEEHDGAEEEEEHHGHAFPMGLTFVVIGVCITLGAEVLTMSLLKSKHNANCDPVNTKEVEITTKDTKDAKNDVICAGHDHGHGHGHEHEESAISTTTTDMHHHTDIIVHDKDQSVMKALVMECCIAIHSVVIGVALGGADEYDELSAVIGAYVFHQFFEGIALGTASLESDFDRTTSIIFCAVFALSVPLGIIIGMSATDDSVDGTITKASFSCVAAGSLIYTSLVEMLGANMEAQIHSGHVHDAAAVSKKNKNLLISYLSFCAGCAGMAVLAIWA